MTDAVYIRLAGPLQSWAGPAVTGNIVRTERFPTVTALRGLIAGALGARRGEFPEWLNDIEFSIRQDRKPHIVDDFQTINPRPESTTFRRRMLLVQRKSASSKKAITFTPDAQGGTSIVQRTYLADGEFLVRIVCNDHLDEIEDALASPKFVTYLGRKAFPPSFPFYLGRGSSEAFTQIPTLPESEHAPQPEARTLEVRQYYDAGNGLPPQEARSRAQFSVVATQDERLEIISSLLDIRRPLQETA